MGELQFTDVAGDGDHDFGDDVLAVLDEFGGGFENGTCLVFRDFRIGDGKTDTAVAHHRVVLLQGVHAFADFVFGDVEGF